MRGSEAVSVMLGSNGMHICSSMHQDIYRQATCMIASAWATQYRYWGLCDIVMLLTSYAFETS